MIDPIALTIGTLRSRARLARRGEFRPEEIRSVGLFELTRLGDVLSALPAIRSFRRAVGGADIHMFVEARWAPLLAEMLPEVKVHALDASDSVPGMVRASALVREIRPELAVSLSPANRNALLCLSSGSRMKAGYLRYANTLTPFLGSHPVEGFGLRLAQDISYGRENIYRRASKVFEALGLGTPEGDEPGPPRASDRVAGVTPYVVFHPFAGWEPRSWPLESFAGLARAAVRELDLEVLFVHAPEEAGRARELLELCRGMKSIRFFSSPRLGELAGVIQGALAFVGNDSGPLHLAAALGVPVIGLFGAAPPELTAPLWATGVMLYRKVECSPCDQRYCRLPGRSCMSRIEVRDVLGALEPVVNSCETPADG